MTRAGRPEVEEEEEEEGVVVVPVEEEGIGIKPHLSLWRKR